jgi:uncharacterized metal-binding protein YceD (DUF177 family)
VKKSDYFKQFDIRFGSLAIGKHQTEIEIEKAFFEKYINDDIIDASVIVKIDIEKKENMIQLLFDLSGNLHTTCDLCLEELIIPVDKQEVLLLQLTDVPKESDDENIVYLKNTEYSYNVEQIIYEYLVTLIPMRKTHQETENQQCDESMLALIEKAKTKENPVVDQRWEKLKDIKFE